MLYNTLENVFYSMTGRFSPHYTHITLPGSSHLRGLLCWGLCAARRNLADDHRGPFQKSKKKKNVKGNTQKRKRLRCYSCFTTTGRHAKSVECLNVRVVFRLICSKETP